MKKTFILFCLYLFSSNLSAQALSRLFADPNIVWAAEMTTDFVLEPEYTMSDSASEYLSYSIPLKMINREPHPSSEWDVQIHGRLQHLFFDKMSAGACYADPELRIPLSEGQAFDRLVMRDTVITFDPETFEEKITLASNCDPFYYIHRIRARQILYFNQKTGDFDVLTLAIAPMLLRGFEDKTVPYIPFWLKMESPKGKPQRWQHPDVSWARRLFPVNPPEFSKLKLIKYEHPPVLERWLERVRRDARYEIWAAYDTDKRIDAEAREKIFVDQDTVVTFDAETYEEIKAFAHYELHPGDIHALRLGQDWCWDDRKKQLSIRLSAYAPTRAERDEDGNLRYYRTLFWRYKP